jgi:AraC-like DNA-binding protein
MSSEVAAPSGRHDSNVASLAKRRNDQVDNLSESTVVAHIALRPADSPRIGGEDIEHVHALAQMTEPLPPIVVHRPTMRVIDGMHRLRASTLRGENKIQACFFDGTAEEAFVLAVRSNAAHGLPLTQLDRTAAASRILAAYPQWSDAAIASVAGVSDKTVAALRRRSTPDLPKLTDRVGRDGRMRPVDPAEGRLRASDYLAAKPDAGIREVARAAGIARATAKDVRRRISEGQDPVPRRLRHTSPTQSQPRSIDPETAHVQGKPLVKVGATTRQRAMQALRSDPSLRMTDAGRMVLRLLDAHNIDAAVWRQLSDNVPTHCAQSVIEIARDCLAAWASFVKQLEDRSSST